MLASFGFSPGAAWGIPDLTPPGIDIGGSTFNPVPPPGARVGPPAPVGVNAQGQQVYQTPTGQTFAVTAPKSSVTPWVVAGVVALAAVGVFVATR